MTAPPRLLVLAKAPVPGHVKTRLCPPCSPEQAATIARAALSATLAAVGATPGVVPRLVLDGEPGPWCPPGIEIVAQGDGGLADRLTAAFAGVDGPALLVGMDTPQVGPATLGAVVDRLAAPDTDAVLGRTADGGWWTIGLRDPRVPAFTGVPMSTPATGERQLARLRELGLRTTLVESAVDVDTFATARVVAAAMPGSDFAAVVDRVAAAIAGRPAA